MFKTEKDYQTSVMKELKTKGWVYKIPDVNMQIKPFDIIGIASGAPYAIELKICNLKRGLSYEQAYNMLRPNQVAALNGYRQSGGVSHLRVYNKAEEKEYRFIFKFLDGISNEL